MGRFWTYFRETLRWPLTWRPGPLSALVRGLAGALDQAIEDMLWLREQFTPKTCLDSSIEGFALSRGIRRHPLETDGQYRSRVIMAYAWQLLGGRDRGLRTILARYGYPVTDIANLRDEDPDRWAEFRVQVEPERGLGERDFELLDWLVNDLKPARSRLAALRLRREERKTAFEGLYVSQGDTHRIPIRFAPMIDPGATGVGLCLCVSDRTTVPVLDPSPSIAPTSLRVGLAVRLATTTTIRSA